MNEKARETRKESDRAAHGPAEEMAEHLRHGEGNAFVMLEDGDPRLNPAPDSVNWDWDADAVSAAPHCQYCGASEPLFKLEDGVLACGACVHGKAAGESRAR